MQKKLIALAVASVVSAPVFAQSQVTIYGVVDVGIESAKYSDAAGNLTRMFSGGNTTNRIGFKGTEDLGNGMKANFVLEGQPSPDVGTHAAAFWHRTSTVGLSGGWGSVNFGSQYTPWFSARAANDIFYTAGAGSNYNFEGFQTRMSNSVRFDSANYNGFSFAVMYGFGETGTTTATTSIFGFKPGAGFTTATYNGQEGTTAATKNVGKDVGLNAVYANGPLAVRYGYDRQQEFFIDGTGEKSNLTINSLNGSYDFKVVKLVAGWTKNQLSNDNLDYRAWYIGGVMPVFGKDLIKLEYTKGLNKTTGASSADANLIAIGYEHLMSKRTTLYATYAKLKNDTNSPMTLLGGDAVLAGFDPSSFQMGLKHSF